MLPKDLFEQRNTHYIFQWSAYADPCTLGGERDRGDTESPKEADHTMHRGGAFFFFRKLGCPISSPL